MPRKSTLYNSLKGRVQDAGDEISNRVRDLQEQSEDYLAENPMKSALILFGVGVVVGAILSKLMERR